jgi:hypothetical protein
VTTLLALRLAEAGDGRTTRLRLDDHLLGVASDEFVAMLESGWQTILGPQGLKGWVERAPGAPDKKPRAGSKRPTKQPAKRRGARR